MEHYAMGTNANPWKRKGLHSHLEEVPSGAGAVAAESEQFPPPCKYLWCVEVSKRLKAEHTVANFLAQNQDQIGSAGESRLGLEP